MAIHVRCTDCDFVFKMRVEASGKKAACPICGEVNRVPNASLPSRTWGHCRRLVVRTGNLLERGVTAIPRRIARAISVYSHWL